MHREGTDPLLKDRVLVIWGWNAGSVVAHGCVLPCTLAHALVVLHKALTTGHETPTVDEHMKEKM